MRTHYAYTSFVLIFCGQILLAQVPHQEGIPPDDFVPRLDPISQALDENHDGELSAIEIGKAPELLRGLDRNKDGELTLDELLPGSSVGPGGPGGRRGGGMGPNRPEMKLAKKHDQDGNGYLDPAERKAAIEEIAVNGTNRPGRRPRGGHGSAGEPGRPGATVAPSDVKK